MLVLMVVVVGVVSVGRDLKRLTMVVGGEVVQAVVGLLWVVLRAGEEENLVWKVAMVAPWEIFPLLVGAL